VVERPPAGEKKEKKVSLPNVKPMRRRAKVEPPPPIRSADSEERKTGT
jgi:hypothetical protein